MRITRQQSIVIAALLLVGFFVVSVLFSKSGEERPSSQAPTPVPSPGVEGPSSGELKFELEHFHRSETQEGKLLWEVNASKGQYFPQSNSAKVFDAEVHLMRKTGEKVTIHAKEALITLSGATLSKVHATGGVKGESGNATFTGNEASVDRTTGDISAPGPVTIQNESMTLEGTDLVGNMNTKEFKLIHDVRTTLAPRAKLPGKPPEQDTAAAAAKRSKK